ncbi:MAG: hypothetical protein ACREO5_14450, partial [Candidatus Binatia bacterium]
MTNKWASAAQIWSTARFPELKSLSVVVSADHAGLLDDDRSTTTDRFFLQSQGGTGKERDGLR